MQVRVVADQPWDVQADVLAIPIVGEPAFGGPLAELNRRTGGELATLATFGELRAKRYTSALAAPGDLPATRVVTISAGPADALDRETVLHVGAAAEHRLGGRHARSLAIWLTPLDRIAGGLEAVAELVARGVVEGSFEPRALYRDRSEISTAPPILEELILIAPGADLGPLGRAAERGMIIGEGANHARTLS
ncbi:MAG TPA: M17 family peptidase N-terminal domain-containing protein, partial [Candidatus Limnocylindrales bacterium]|nr:M17 family peptidase N-terminal domain-containing protein [Candidatus Limnocylindrales bacterium]